MAKNNFEDEFQEKFTEMVEIAFEFVENNKEETDCIYVYGSMEKNNLFYNVFYKVNGQILKKHEVNKYLQRSVDISGERQSSLLDLGLELLSDIVKVFKKYNREVPTLMQMKYFPKTGQFKNDISYDLQYSNHKNWTNVNVFNLWFEKEKNS